MSNDRIVLGGHWLVCIILAVAWGLHGDVSAMSTFVAASLVISALGLVVSR